jgi:hypothetical protein
MAFSFFVYFLITFLKIPVHNYDFWWHLATGKHIVENQSLPHDDPFSYTSHEAPSTRKLIILRGNWLAEVIFYKVYSVWEFKGIIILRSLLLLLFLLFVFMNIKKQNVSDLVALLFMASVFFIAKKTGAERPQLFTFIVFSFVYYLLEDFRINRSKKVFLIPLFVMVLSNMHPGYIVCLMLITLYLAGEGIRSFLSKDYKDGIFKGLLIVWVMTIFFSLFNPNGAEVLTRIFSIHDKHTIGIVEFRSPFFLYGRKVLDINYSYIFFLLFSLLSLRYLRKTGIIHILLLVSFTVMSLVSIRYMIFYMCVSAPILARLFVNLKDERLFQKFSGFLKTREPFMYVVACIFGIFLVFNALPSFARYEYKADTVYSAPQDAADFLSNVELKGNMFNEYGFGGYLVWRLFPEKKVFIDGRSLEPSVYKEYQMVAYALESQDQSWEDIIKRYNISYIIMPSLQYQGTIFPLVEKLFESEEWVLIYTDHLSLIFLRNDPENMSVIERFAIDKRRGLNTIIIQASAKALKKQGNPYFLISIGKVFFKMGRLDDAEKAFMMAYERDPDNVGIKEWLKVVKDNREQCEAEGIL